MVGGGVVCTGDPLDRLEVGVGGGELCPIRWWLPGSGVSVTLISGLSAPSRQGGGELGTTLTTPWSMLIIVLQLDVKLCPCRSEGNLKLLSLFFNFSDFWQKKSIVCSRCASIKLLMSVERVLTSFLLSHPRSFLGLPNGPTAVSRRLQVCKSSMCARAHAQSVPLHNDVVEPI